MWTFAALTLSCLISILTTTAENGHTFQHKGLERSCVHNCECEWPRVENKTGLWLNGCKDQCCVEADTMKLEKLENDFENCILIKNGLKEKHSQCTIANSTCKIELNAAKENNFELTKANSTCKIELNALKEKNFELTIANSTCKIELKAVKENNFELTIANSTCKIELNDLKHVKEVNGQQAKQIRDHEISIGVLVPVLVLVIVTLVVYIIHLQMSLNKLTKTKKKVIQSQAASGDVSSVPHEIPGNETELKVLLPPEDENVRNEDDIHASGY